MKKILFLLIACISFSLSAQNEENAGTYFLFNETVKGEILDYKLDLNSDGTFQFTSYRKDISKNEYHHHSKGTWTVSNKVIHFTTENIDLEDKKALDFTGTTARVFKKSPRNKSDEVKPTFLQFYKSKIFWIENLKISKKE
ncbi:MAG TPA: lipocalin family protein [Flavobacterium sp.]|uniref:lipocalin family protein n=1 Tax=unclassified Flavobacterium TaxID=196869 RepID=UPI0025C59E70|nr:MULTISPECIES: lipocalin family protein [unclassified Flavobacterium]HRE78092.1 lipocalin family protein [Flavobacterium sp.]